MMVRMKREVVFYVLLVCLLVLGSFSVVGAVDVDGYGWRDLQEGRLTKRTPKMERVADEIYDSDPENYIFNAMEFSENYLKRESWTDYAFMSAKESFEKRVGTCTEVSVLYCAMMRYKGIPCTFRIMQVNVGHGDMFPVVYLNGLWYYPEEIWNPNYETYWVLSLDSDVMRGSLDRTNEFAVKEW